MTQGFDANQHDQRDRAEEQELLGLLSLLCESRATEEDVSRLESLLQSRPEYVECYVAYMDMHGALHLREIETAALAMASRQGGGSVSAGSGIESGVGAESIRSLLEEDAEVAQREAAERARIESLAAEKFSAFQRERDRNRRPAPVAVPQNAFYATVSSLAAAAILFIFWMLPDPVPTPVFVASITDSIDARWSNPSLSAEPGTQLFTLENLVLTRGIVEIEFEGGARAVVEAPATLELLSPDSARLEWGRLVGHVPRTEVQLTIKTPQASITDLGTEFGVEVNRQQVTHLHVFEGSVLAAVLDAEGKTAQQQTVLVDEAVYLQPKTGVIKPAPAVTANRFVRQVPVPMPLYSTGIGLAKGDAEGPLLKPGDQDPHWKITACPDDNFSTPGYAIAISKRTGWIANGPNSNWISTSVSSSHPGGVYVYETTFNLIGVNLSTVTIAGKYSVDNDVTDVLINGASTGISGGVSTGTSGSESFFPFSIKRGFIAGVNTLEFVTRNSSGGRPNDPHGLRVEMELDSSPIREEQ